MFQKQQATWGKKQPNEPTPENRPLSRAQVEHGETVYQTMRPVCGNCGKRPPKVAELDRLLVYAERFGHAWIVQNLANSKPYCVCPSRWTDDTACQWLGKHLKVVVVLIKLYPKLASTGNHKDRREARYLLKVVSDHLNGKPLGPVDRTRLSRFKKRANKILYEREIPETELCLSQVLNTFTPQYIYEPLYFRGRTVVPKRTSAIAKWALIYCKNPKDNRIGILYVKAAIDSLFDAFQYPEYDAAEDAVPQDVCETIEIETDQGQYDD